MTSNNSHTTPTLSATYISPNNDHFQHTTQLAAPISLEPKDRTVYLSSLKKACAELQDVVNKELTQRMEEDNARAAATGTKVKIDDKKEEENYGEEVVEED